MRKLFPLSRPSMKLIRKSEWSTWLKLALGLVIFYLMFSVALICLAAVITVHSLSIGSSVTG